MVDICMELLQPYMELRPERDPPRVRSCPCPSVGNTINIAAV